MQCPNCDKQIWPDQKFCRFCGGSLEAVSRAPSEHPTVGDLDQPKAKVTNRMPARRMNRTLLWGIVVTGLGISLLANAQDYELINWLGILVFLAGVGLAVYGMFSTDKAKVLSSDQSSQPKVLNHSEADLYLPPERFSDPVATVTERTTELLEQKVKTPKLTKHRDAGG